MRPQVVLKDSSIEILLELIPVLSVHDQPVLRLSDLLLWLDALHLVWLLASLRVSLDYMSRVDLETLRLSGHI